MRLTDQFGYELTLSDKEALTAWNETGADVRAPGASIRRRRSPY